ncbi:hypothetical protein [Pseudorhodoplanes sp.]|uniref:hypothetical protein n=1 Tax=Pseudorhodoplanes sp. TaxID=1934341 RepID=UPI003D12D4A1
MTRLVTAAAAGLAMALIGSPALPTASTAIKKAQLSESSSAAWSSAEWSWAEWSSAKKRRYSRTYRKPVYAYRVPRQTRLGDPSLGPNGLPYRRPYDPGGCIIDEGYGRFTNCSNR